MVPKQHSAGCEHRHRYGVIQIRLDAAGTETISRRSERSSTADLQIRVPKLHLLGRCLARRRSCDCSSNRAGSPAPPCLRRREELLRCRSPQHDVAMVVLPAAEDCLTDTGGSCRQEMIGNTQLASGTLLGDYSTVTQATATDALQVTERQATLDAVDCACMSARNVSSAIERCQGGIVDHHVRAMAKQ